jgi:hypothetical protein
MSFLQKEADRVRSALLQTPMGHAYDRLYAAQQALAWAIEPQGFKPPYDMIMGTPADSEDCPVHTHLPSS